MAAALNEDYQRTLHEQKKEREDYRWHCSYYSNSGKDLILDYINNLPEKEKIQN